MKEDLKLYAKYLQSLLPIKDGSCYWNLDQYINEGIIKDLICKNTGIASQQAYIEHYAHSIMVDLQLKVLTFEQFLQEPA